MDNQYSVTSRSGLKRYLTRAALKRAFVGTHGLRAGWGVLLFYAIGAALLAAAIFIMRHFHPESHAPQAMMLRRMVIWECVLLAIGLLATKIMSMIDRRSWLDYGLRDPRRFALFMQGAGAGIVSMLILIAALYGVHAIHIERTVDLSGSVAEDGLLWGLLFILVGFNEELIFRGYAFFRLFRTIRPWLAGLASSLVFAAAHGGNGGESVAGMMTVIGAGLLLCLFVWRTNSLWLAIGFHAAWDWTQTFVFGVADSGSASSAHWLNSQPAGPAWLSGGTVGPEGSLLVLPLLVMVALIAVRWLPARQRPTLLAGR